MKKYEKLEHSAMRMITHEEDTCKNQYCTIHNRSDHHMRGWPQFYRFDRAIMERICTHGVAHPDPDEYRISCGFDDGGHGCDGCCNLINSNEDTKIKETNKGN